MLLASAEGVAVAGEAQVHVWTTMAIMFAHLRPSHLRSSGVHTVGEPGVYELR